MADEPKTEAPEGKEPESKQDEGKAESKTQEKTLTQAEVDRIVADRVGRERSKFADYNDLKTKAVQFDELQEENKSELEKLTGKVTSLSDMNKSLEGQNLRLQVALSKGLTGDKADLADRLRGGTKEELEADADTLLSHFAPANPEDGNEKEKEAETPPPPTFDGGPRVPAPEAKNPEQAHNDFIVNLLGPPRADNT